MAPNPLRSLDRLERFSGLVIAARARGLTAQEVALESVRRAIVSGVFEPGDRLRQEDIAAAMHTSRIPVREALRVLEHEGLVTSEPNRGFTVAAVDAADIEEIYDLRILLECACLRLAIPLLEEADLRTLEAAADRLARAATPDEAVAARDSFYDYLYGIPGRPRTAALIGRLRNDVARALRRVASEDSGAVHAALLDALRAGDAELATSTLTAHYQRVALQIRRHLREAQAAQAR